MDVLRWLRQFVLISNTAMSSTQSDHSVYPTSHPNAAAKGSVPIYDGKRIHQVCVAVEWYIELLGRNDVVVLADEAFTVWISRHSRRATVITCRVSLIAVEIMCTTKQARLGFNFSSSGGMLRCLFVSVGPASRRNSTIHLRSG
jgi:hypothetical protein